MEGISQKTFCSAQLLSGDKDGNIEASGKILGTKVKNEELEKAILEALSTRDFIKRMEGVGVSVREDGSKVIVRAIGDSGHKIFSNFGTITTSAPLDPSVQKEIMEIEDRDNPLGAAIAILEERGILRDSLEINSQYQGINIEEQSTHDESRSIQKARNSRDDLESKLAGVHSEAEKEAILEGLDEDTRRRLLQQMHEEKYGKRYHQSEEIDKVH